LAAAIGGVISDIVNHKTSMMKSSPAPQARVDLLWAGY